MISAHPDCEKVRLIGEVGSGDCVSVEWKMGSSLREGWKVREKGCKRGLREKNKMGNVWLRLEMTQSD